MHIKNAIPNDSDDLRPEYDLSELKGGVQGKYFKQATAAGTTLVLLEPDVAEAFPDAATVNQALRAFMKVARSQARNIQGGKPPNKGLRPSASRA